MDLENANGHNNVWKRNEPDSPCVNVCVIHTGTGFCLGCYRTPDEIKNWSKYTSEERFILNKALENRQKDIYKRRRRKN